MNRNEVKEIMKEVLNENQEAFNEKVFEMEMALERMEDEIALIKEIPRKQVVEKKTVYELDQKQIDWEPLIEKMKKTMARSINARIRHSTRKILKKEGITK